MENIGKLLFIGLNDYMLRNLLCSSFPDAARRLNLPLHGFVYSDTYPAYNDLLKTRLEMTTSPYKLVMADNIADRKFNRIAFRAANFRCGRLKNRTYKIIRRQYWYEAGARYFPRMRMEASFIFGRVGGIFGLERVYAKKYFKGVEKLAYVRDICIPELDKFKPKAVISSSPETFFDVPWLVAAGILGIKRIIWIRSWDNITSKINIMPEADLYLIWSDLMKSEFQEYYPEYMEKKLVRIGTLQFDGHVDPSNVIQRDEFCRVMRLDPGRPFLLYCTGGPHIVPNEHLIIQEIMKILKGIEKPKRPQLLIRLHPYFWNTDLKEYIELENVSIWPRREDIERLKGGFTTGLYDEYSLMISSFFHQAANINIASTVTLDSAVFNKPIINIAYDGPQKLHPFISTTRCYPREHYIPIVRSGAVHMAWSFEDLKRCINEVLNKPDNRANERKKMIELECGNVDGKAGERLAEVLNTFLVQ